MLLRAATVMVGVGRIAIGVPLTVRPAVARLWIGEDATGRGSQALTRGLAGRDAVLGAGLLAAVARNEGASAWLVAGAGADAVDLVATVLAGDALPASPRIATIALAGSAAVAAIALAAAWRYRSASADARPGV